MLRSLEISASPERGMHNSYWSSGMAKVPSPPLSSSPGAEKTVVGNSRVAEVWQVGYTASAPTVGNNIWGPSISRRSTTQGSEGANAERMVVDDFP